jgi:FkbM family methyltransferase
VDANPALEYLCVEPDHGFYAYLQHNARVIQAACPEAKVHTVQALVGHDGGAAVLDGSGGSKHALPVAAGAPVATGPEAAVHHAVPLDRILPDTLGEPWQRVSLLKSDVDGFDHEVLASASEVIRQCRPMIFFECQATNEDQHQAYQDCARQLGALGYSQFWLLDNYGNPMLQVSSSDAVIQMLDYLWRQQTGRATRSMYYVDILASFPEQQALADHAIAELCTM